MQPDGIHTIPVPRGWSVEQAWEHIARGTPVPHTANVWAQDNLQGWANVEVKNGMMVKSITNEGGR